jgi:hypothetical protein
MKLWTSIFRDASPAPIAQLDRALVYGTSCRKFESSWARIDSRRDRRKLPILRVDADSQRLTHSRRERFAADVSMHVETVTVPSQTIENTRVNLHSRPRASGDLPVDSMDSMHYESIRKRRERLEAGEAERGLLVYFERGRPTIRGAQQFPDGLLGPSGT